KKSNHLAGLFAIQKFIQTYIIFKERVILQIVKLFFHNNLTDSLYPKIQIYVLNNYIIIYNP
ncbi:hypothetical protein P5F38_14690, partial [Clostridium perfringens]|nr:hypothetical protein [Clostridium perfringens]MDK0900048.1 hypothetical protein [Clostridium perfringens]